jgi:putative hydrolase of the HAD superfamily
LKYEAVIFDLFGTLIENYSFAESENVLRGMAAEMGVPPEDFVSLWHQTFYGRMEGSFKSYQDCIRHICRQMGVTADDEIIEKVAGIRFRMNREDLTSPRDEAIEVISSLKETGHKIGLLSDCSMETPLVWQESPLAPLIDAPVFSCLEGIKKPDPNFYMIAVNRLAVHPEKCIYVADGIGKELPAAAELGMYPVKILVPGEDDYDPYREEWNGPVISSLREILEIVK